MFVALSSDQGKGDVNLRIKDVFVFAGSKINHDTLELTPACRPCMSIIISLDRSG